MRGTTAALAALALVTAAAAHLDAQVAFGVEAGVRYSSTLVSDSIVAPFSVRPALAPAVAITLAEQREHGWVPMANLDVSTSNLTRHDADGTTTTLGQVTTVAFTVGVTRPVRGGFTLGLGAGGLKYLPSQDAGIFQAGAGALAGIGALTVGHALPVGGRRFTIAARYDIHGFTTPALQDGGFHGLRAVHRVALTLHSDWGTAR